MAKHVVRSIVGTISIILVGFGINQTVASTERRNGPAAAGTAMITVPRQAVTPRAARRSCEVRWRVRDG